MGLRRSSHQRQSLDHRPQSTCGTLESFTFLEGLLGNYLLEKNEGLLCLEYSDHHVGAKILM